MSSINNDLEIKSKGDLILNASNNDIILKSDVNVEGDSSTTGKITGADVVATTKGIFNKIQCGNNEIGLNNNLLFDLQCEGEALFKDQVQVKNLIINDLSTGVGRISLGTGTTADINDITTIESNVYDNDSATELLLFKGNNSTTLGPDRIRLKSANIILETYDNLSNNNHSNERTNLIIDRLGNIEMNGNLNINGTLSKNNVEIQTNNIVEYDRTLIYEKLLNEKKAVIAHRFSKLTHEPYSLKSIKNLVEQGIFLIEIDVNLTQETDINDRIFYISHGNMEEIGSENVPSPVLKSNLKSTVISHNNNFLSGATLPTLEEFFYYARNFPVCILMEDKSGQPQKLYDFCQTIGLSNKYAIAQDFDNSMLDIFKAGGYKTMKIGGSLTAQEIEDYDYFCCGSGNLSTFQAYNIDKFIYYTNEDPEDHQAKLSTYSKLSGCFSDAAVPCLYHNLKSDRSLLTPENGFISAKYENNNIAKYVRFYQNGKGDFCLNIEKEKAALGDHRFFINCFNYSLSQGIDHYFYIERLFSANINIHHWVSIILKFSNYAEYDAAGSRINCINILFRRDGRVQPYKLTNGSASQISTNNHSLNFVYWQVNISENTSTNFYLTVRGSETLQGPYTVVSNDLINYSDYDNFNASSKIYLAFGNRGEWVGEMKYLNIR